MPIEPTVFSQVMRFLPHNEFHRCVARYCGNGKTRSFTCMDQFLCLAFAQLIYRESLRDIETCLRAMQPKLYHMGIRGRVARWQVELFFKWIIPSRVQAGLNAKAPKFLKKPGNPAFSKTCGRRFPPPLYQVAFD